MKILNMKYLIVLFFFILVFNNNYAQDEKNESDSTVVIELKEFYDGKGVIFGKDVEYGWYRDSADQRISLSLEDVIEAEKIIDSMVYLFNKNDINHKNVLSTELREYYRQYWGLKSCSNEKKIAIIMYNFNDPYTRKRMEDRWDKEDYIVSGTMLAKKFIFINLTKRELLIGKLALTFWEK